jgi:hypothetical protein
MFPEFRKMASEASRDPASIGVTKKRDAPPAVS